MIIPEPLIAAAVSIFAVLLAGVLADIGIWRRSLSRDLRRMAERVAVVETAIHYMSPASHRRARREVENQ